MAMDSLENFIKALGTTTEIWLIVYQSFKKLGMNEEDALKHTEGCMTSILKSIYGNPKKEDENDKS